MKELLGDWYDIVMPILKSDTGQKIKETLLKNSSEGKIILPSVFLKDILIPFSKISYENCKEIEILLKPPITNNNWYDNKHLNKLFLYHQLTIEENVIQSHSELWDEFIIKFLESINKSITVKLDYNKRYLTINNPIITLNFIDLPKYFLNNNNEENFDYMSSIPF